MKIIITIYLLLAGLTISAAEYHVAKTGKDTNPGTAASPFLTIQRAADVAQPGDVITVHAGIYREEVTPPRGGTSDDKRIVYQAAEGADVEIRGSEVVTGWKAAGEGIWKVEVPNTVFGDFNPFADVVSGDWFKGGDRKHHTGCVYLNGEWLFEAASKDSLKTSKWKKAWYAEVDEDVTTIWAYFNGTDPNEGLTEINVRQTVFYPRKPFQNYITVRGFKMRHAAPKWAPPTAEQMGLIGTHWSKGWIIEDNEISHSINVGLTLGKYGDEHDNQASMHQGGGAQAYNETIDRALSEMKWNKETIGSHVVRNNEISYCEQAGIVGSMGAAFSRIIGNRIHDIHPQGRFHGFEFGGIKFHGAIDTLISGNLIYRASNGIWLDWMTQGTRVTRNVLHSNLPRDLFIEVNHGPFLVDNNIFLSMRNLHDMSQGGAYVHNLFAGDMSGGRKVGRVTPFHKEHSTEIAGRQNISGGDNRFYNNVFAHADLSTYDKIARPMHFGGNVYYQGAKPAQNEADPVVVEENPAFRIIEQGDQVFLEITLSPEQAKANTELVTTELLGKAQIPDLPYLDHDGSPIRIDTDYSGQPRDPQNPTPGPFENPPAGRVKLQVW